MKKTKEFSMERLVIWLCIGIGITLFFIVMIPYLPKEAKARFMNTEKSERLQNLHREIARLEKKCVLLDIERESLRISADSSQKATDRFLVVLAHLRKQQTIHPNSFDSQIIRYNELNLGYSRFMLTYSKNHLSKLEEAYRIISKEKSLRERELFFNEFFIYLRMWICLMSIIGFVWAVSALLKRLV